MNGDVTSGARLERALSALRGDRWLVALDALLDAWAAHKSAEIADLIEVLGRVLNRALPPVKGRAKGRALRDAGLEALALGHSVDVARVIARFDDASASALMLWFHALGDFKPDPRVPLPVLRAVLRYSSDAVGPARTAALSLLQKVSDGRLLAHLPQLASSRAWTRQLDRFAETLAPPPPLLTSMEGLVAQLRQAIADCEAAPPPSVDRLRATQPRDHKAAQAQALLDAVFADPAADEPRWVYADWLSQRGDPRGELIMLQYARRDGEPSDAQTAREKALLEAHAARWLQPLDAVVVKPRFERGFLHGVERIRRITRLQRHTLLAHPLWATLEEVDERLEADLLLSGAVKSLRRCRMDAATLRRLTQVSSPPPLEHVDTWWVDLERVRQLPPSGYPEALETQLQDLAIHDIAHFGADVGHLSRLTSLGIDPADPAMSSPEATMDGYRWLLDSPLGRQLRRLRIGHWGGAQLKGFIDAMCERPRLATLQLDGRAFEWLAKTSWVIERRPQGKFALSVSFKRWWLGQGESPVESLMQYMLTGFPDPRVPELKIDPDGDDEDEVMDVVRSRFPRIVRSGS